MKTTGFSSTKPLTVDNMQKHAKAPAVTSKKRKVSRPVSLKRTFLCQDKDYPRSKPKALLSIQKAFASSGPSVHWRGDDRALFELDPAAKYNIRDYLLEQCEATTQTTNELTKPTGTKVVFVIRFNDDDIEQEALCVQTNAATLHGIYNFRNVHPSVKNAPAAPKMFPRSAKNAAPRRLPRSRGTTSLTSSMASAKAEDFPLPDRELDSDGDSDEGDEETAPPPYNTALAVITEGDEDEKEENVDGFVDVVDIGAPKYCRDPDSANHPECHGRYKVRSYAHSVVDAELDFQERFVTAYSGHDSAAYYCNWRLLKHDHGEIMVHGQSLLRNSIASPEDEGGRSDGELEDTTEQLLHLIDKKFGPLTLEGQRAKPAEPETNCSAECIAKVNEYLSRSPDENRWPPGQSFDVKNEDLVSQPDTLFEGVANPSDFDDVPAPTSTSTSAQAKCSNAPFMTEAEFEKLINTPHEDFVNSYLHRYETMRINTTRARQVREEAHHSSVSPEEAKGNLTVEPNTVIEQVVALPKLIVTAATPASSPAKDLALSTTVPIESHEITVTTILHAPFAVPEAVAEHMASAPPCDVTALVSACVPIEAVTPLVLPVIISHEAVPAETSIRPPSVQSMCSSRDGPSCPASVFSRRASVTTKPSNEGIWSDSLRLIDTLNLQVNAKSTLLTVSHYERSVSMPTLTLSAPNTRETSVDVSESDQSVYAQATYAVPSTPVRIVLAMNKHLTLIVEVQTPLSSSAVPPTTMYTNTVVEDPYENTSTPIFDHPQPYANAPRACVPRDEPAQRMPASVFTDDSSFTDRQPPGNKFAAGIKDRAQTVARATMQTTQRALRPLKRLRANAHYFAATFSSRNPFETVSRR